MSNLAHLGNMLRPACGWPAWGHFIIWKIFPARGRIILDFVLDDYTQSLVMHCINLWSFIIKLYAQILYNFYTIMSNMIYRQDNISIQILKLRMLLKRNMFKHHDVIAYFQRLSQEFTLCSIDSLWGMFVNHNIFAFNLVKKVDSLYFVSDLPIH